MNPYIRNITTAAILFPLIAIALTLPMVWFHYRRYGRLHGGRAIMLYAFIFYCICALFLILLPLPHITDDFCTTHKYLPRLKPFTFIKDIQRDFDEGISFKELLRNDAFRVTAFNVLLLFPLGYFLRYLFAMRFWPAAFIIFGTTLFFEVTQLTGIYGIYPCAYRFFEVDDLMTNTTGGLLGFWIAGKRQFLPDVLPQASKLHHSINMTQRFLAAAVDWLIVSQLIPPNKHLGQHFLYSSFWIVLYFIILPAIWRGATLGKHLLHIRLEAVNGKHLWPKLLLRYLIMLMIPIALADWLTEMMKSFPEKPVYGILLLALLPAWVGCIVVLTYLRKDHRGLHDLVAGTTHGWLFRNRNNKGG